MIGRLLASCLVFLLSALPTMSEVFVKSGSHPGFDRLVVYLSEKQEWEISEIGERHLFTVNDLSEGFDIENVYQTISRSRLRAIRSSQDSLEIELGCDCRLVANTLATGQVVIDVFGSGSSDPLGSASDLAPTTLRNLENPQEQPDPRAEKELKQFRMKLFKDLGRSISLSLLDLNDRQENSRPATTMPSVFDRIETSERIRLYNAIEDAQKRSGGKGKIVQAPQCPAQEIFKIRDWAEEEKFSETIADLRSSLVNEFDEIDEKVSYSLVRLYIYYGLTPEAKAILSKVSLSQNRSDHLSSMIDILDGVKTSESSSFSEWTHCEGAITPWLVLFDPQKSDLSEEVRKTLVFEVSSWPPSILETVGSQLSEILQERGYSTTASVIQDIVSGKNADTVLQELQLANLSSSELYELANSGQDQSALALGLYLERAIGQSRAIQKEDLELASAYEFELQDLPVSSFLLEQRLKALAYLGDSGVLLEQLNTTQVSDPGLVMSVIDQITVLSLKSENESQTSLLTNFILRNRLASFLESQTHRMAVQHTLDSGLPSLSKELLDAKKEAENTEQLRTKYALSKKDLSLLAAINLDDLDESDLSLVARLALAEEELEIIPNNKRSVLTRNLQDRFAFASLEWDSVTSEGNIGQVAQAIVDSSAVESQDRPLMSAKNIIEQSVLGRNLVDEIFSQ